MARSRTNYRRAFTTLYAGVCLTVMSAFVSLSVDFGRVQVARSQLITAVDAAARYASTGIADGTYLAKAQAAASANAVDTGSLALTSSDVELGTWNASTKVFTAGGSTPNALRVTGRRSTARGTSITTPFAGLIGRSSVDLTCQAISLATTTTSGGTSDIVGLNSVSLTGGTRIRRLAGESGTVRVGTNNTMSATSGTFIQGDAYYRSTVPAGPASAYTGSKIAMSSNLSFPAPVVPAGATNLGAVNVGWQGLTVPAGNYLCTSLTVGGGGVLTFQGDVNIYCSGAVDIGNGCTLNTSNGAKRVTLNLTSNNTANFNMSSTFHMMVYGPSATLNLTGSSPMVGSAVVNNLNLTGSANLSYSSSLASAGGSGTSSTTVKIVK